jgi:3-oxo-5-alpha-steroid 4-dehydrogenase 3
LTENLSIAHLQMTNAPSLRTFFLVPLRQYRGTWDALGGCIFSTSTGSDGSRAADQTSPGSYLSLALLAAPRGELVNKTMLSCLAFVAVNLGLTDGMLWEGVFFQRVQVVMGVVLQTRRHQEERDEEES